MRSVSVLNVSHSDDLLGFMRRFVLPPHRTRIILSFSSYCVGRLPAQTFANFSWVAPAEQDNDITQDSTISRMSRSHIDFGGPHLRNKYSESRWVASFMSECSCKVLDTVVGRVTNYSVILQLDAKIREFPVLDLPTDASKPPEECGTGNTIQHGFLKNFKEVCEHMLHVYIGYLISLIVHQAFCTCTGIVLHLH